MADQNEFQESSLSEEQLDQILSSGSEDTSLDELLGNAKNQSDKAKKQDQDFQEISDLLSSFGGTEDQPSTPSKENISLDSLTDLRLTKSSVQTDSSDIQKSGLSIKELYDINVKFTVELARTFMFIKDILLLGEGSIVELDKNVGDEVDILINDRLFARGKLVVVDEFYGVQITQILHPAYFSNI
jgi:flagellar motor switch protein FliN/FliY